jgi:hypothetical protein
MMMPLGLVHNLCRGKGVWLGEKEAEGSWRW